MDDAVRGSHVVPGGALADGILAEEASQPLQQPLALLGGVRDPGEAERAVGVFQPFRNPDQVRPMLLAKEVLRTASTSRAYGREDTTTSTDRSNSPRSSIGWTPCPEANPRRPSLRSKPTTSKPPPGQRRGHCQAHVAQAHDTHALHPHRCNIPIEAVPADNRPASQNPAALSRRPRTGPWRVTASPIMPGPPSARLLLDAWSRLQLLPSSANLGMCVAAEATPARLPGVAPRLFLPCSGKLNACIRAAMNETMRATASGSRRCERTTKCALASTSGTSDSGTAARWPYPRPPWGRRTGAGRSFRDRTARNVARHRSSLPPGQPAPTPRPAATRACVRWVGGRAPP